MSRLGPVAVGVEGKSLTATDRERLAHPLVGMVILFSANYESPEQLILLCSDIHALRDPPLLIAVDHEGGRVQRFRDGFTRLPPMRRLGELWDRDVLLACRAAASLGYVMAAELRAHGVDMTFAPVLDIDHGRSKVIGDRALHSDARVVSMLAAHLTHGLLLAGMANCGKHFPGHGWAEADSHFELPVDSRARSDIVNNDAAPYRWLGPMLAGVMPAHVVYSQIDREPAGFSQHWIKKVLREKLGFTGAVFSDDLLMAGAGAAGTVAQRAEAAFNAGCDFALVCNDTAAMDEVLDAVQWQHTAEFDLRVARLKPRGPAPSMTRLRENAEYRSAQQDVSVLLKDPA
ncbi:MAG: beta-N-acetylhexosaminidase [Burkholderiaceae bacterium]|nr:beta-N-acetylhexosaminidase [Burkholderiaceae bacterium]